MKYAILGGGGVFGQHLARHLLNNEHEIVCLGRNPEKHPAFLQVHSGEPRYRYEQVHLTWELDRALELLRQEQPDIIVNFAAQAASGWRDGSWRYYETNNVALVRLTEALLDADWLKQWVQIGTSELYGTCNHPVREEEAPNPTTPYAISKLAADLHLLSLHRLKDFPVTIVRPSNGYGEGQALYRIIPRSILAALTGGNITLDGGGVARKSYLHAEDIARGIAEASLWPATGQVYHLSPLDSITIASLVQLIAVKTGRHFEDFVEGGPERSGQDAEYLLDSQKARHYLCWEPQISLARGIDRMVKWITDNLDYLRGQDAAFTMRG